MIKKIDKDTIKIITEKIIDLKPLRERLADIDKELKEVEKQEDKILVENDRKFRDITDLQNEKEYLENKLKYYDKL